MIEELYDLVTEIKQDLVKIHYKHGKCQDCIALLDKLYVVSDAILQINKGITVTGGGTVTINSISVTSNRGGNDEQ